MTPNYSQHLRSIFRNWVYLYYFRRLHLTFKSWVYWMTMADPETEIYEREIYWSRKKGGVTFAANFWCMVNDGSLDMEFEFFDSQNSFEPK